MLNRFAVDRVLRWDGRPCHFDPVWAMFQRVERMRAETTAGFEWASS